MMNRENIIKEFKRLLKDAVRTHYNIVNKNNDVYAYTLYTCDYGASIGPVCNRESDIVAEPSDEDYIYYRYSADEYEIWDEFSCFDEVNKVMAKAMESDVDESIDDKLLDGALEILMELKEEGLFGIIDDNKYLAIWISDSCNGIMNKSIKHLNTPKVYEQYYSEFGG